MANKNYYRVYYDPWDYIMMGARPNLDRLFHPCYGKSVREWLAERARMVPKGITVSPEMHLTQDDYDFLQTCDTVKKILNDNCIL